MTMYGFAFQLHNVSTRTLYQLPTLAHTSLLWGETSIDRYLKLLLKDQPSHILGLGIYTGPDQDTIRIETVTTNRFRNRFIEGKTLQSQPLHYFIQPGEYLKLAGDLKTSYCNLVSWKIMSLISKGELHAQYTFLHLPRKLDAQTTTSRITAALEYNP